MFDSVENSYIDRIEEYPLYDEYFPTGYSKNAIFTEIYNSIYGFCDKNLIIALINEYNNNGYSGFCTNKWLEQTVAIKCYDCEYDGTCAICLECFFDSDHKGHEYRLTKTSGGCCDCGDVSSWDIKGSCSVHTKGSIFSEKLTLDLFTNGFLLKLEIIIYRIYKSVSYYLYNINEVTGETLQILILFLNDLANATPAYRYCLSLCLSPKVLKDWMLRHQMLPNDFQKTFNSFYLTMITSMSFKKKFSSLFAELYSDIVQPLKEIQDDWHLSNLSVQLFTYSSIAFELVKNQFMDTCIHPILFDSEVDKRLNTVQFPRFDRKKFKIISDLTYLMNHTVVCKLLLSDERIQKTMFVLFLFHNNMNLIERNTKTHVQFENTGYSIAFTVEHSLHSAFKPLSDYIKSIDESNISMVLNFYKNFNDFIKNNGLNVTCNTHKLARSFHIPLVRLFTSVVDFNLVRRYVKYHLTNLAMTDEKMATYLNKSFVHLKSNENFPFDLLQIFDNDVLKYVLKSTVNVLKFAMEIKHNLWVYNGESLREQRKTYYELLFDSFDIASIQMSVVLLGMKNFNTDFDVLSYIFELCFDLEHYETSQFKRVVEEYRKSDITNDAVHETSIQYINNMVDHSMCEVEGGTTIQQPDQQRVQSSDVQVENDRTTVIDYNFIADGHVFAIKADDIQSETSDPGTFDFKINFFYIMLNTLVNDIKHLEIQSISRKTSKEWFVQRGHPLLLMDIVNSLASGNVEFGQIVKETKKHWKHHPMFIETIEQVAIFNYSKVSDKTYIRLKPDAYKFIDILWNTHQPSTHLISNECLNHDISLLGSPDSESMSPEYRETQSLILNSISCNMLLNYVLVVLLNIIKMQFNSNKTDFESLPDLYKKDSNSSPASNYKKFELALNMVSCSNYKIKMSSHLVLYSLKILNLLYSKLPYPEKRTAEILFSTIMSKLTSIDDKVYKKCSNYTLKFLMRIYNFKNTLDNFGIDTVKKDVKMIQKMFLNKILKQQSQFKLESDDMEHLEQPDSEDSIVCILCKEKIDSETAMSFMCFISTNNVLRRCSLTNAVFYDSVPTGQIGNNPGIGSKIVESLTTPKCNNESTSCSISTLGKSYNEIYGDISRRTNYDVYTKSSLPLKSSIISSCGHVAHTKCINEHRNSLPNITNSSRFLLYRGPTEFPCPMCKTLCNFTLNMLTDSMIKNYIDNIDKEEVSIDNVDIDDKMENAGDDSVEVESDMSLDDGNEKSDVSDSQSNGSWLETNSRQYVRNGRKYKRKNFIKDDSIDNKIYELCKYSWRYPYSNFWIPSPVYGTYENHAKYVYGLSSISYTMTLNQYLNSDTKYRTDELSFTSNTSLDNIDCTYCSLFDFGLLNMSSFKCEAFNHNEPIKFPIIRVLDTSNAMKMETVYRFLMSKWDIIESSYVYIHINMHATRLNYTEMFPRAYMTPYSRALFSDRRVYFGIRNWRHVNATVEMDPKFWLLYNELLSTSSLRRNMLNVPNALYSHLLRNLYFSGISFNENHYDFEFLNIQHKKATLDKTYHDCDYTTLVLPELSHYNDKMLDKQANMVRLIVESMTENDLTNMYDNLCNDPDIRYNGSYYEESYDHQRFIDFHTRGTHYKSPIDCLKPLSTYLLNQDKNNPYEMFGNELLLNPWSFDYIREFLQIFLSDRNYTRDDLTDYVYFFMVVASLQLMDRFIVDLMRANYMSFVQHKSKVDEKILKTRNKIEFLTAYMDKFFREFLLNAEFPCDAISRIAFTDFKVHESKFKTYNTLISGVLETRKENTDDELLTKLYDNHYSDTILSMLYNFIEYSRMLKWVHDKHVHALTEPIPYEKIVINGGNTYISDDLLENHMFNQIKRIVKAREIHNNINNGYNFNDITNSLKSVLSKNIQPKRQRMNDGNNNDSQKSLSSIIKISSNDTTIPKPQSYTHDMYKGVDLAKRLNVILYRNHSNTVFFETLKHNIPDSIHILDFVDTIFRTELYKVDLDSSPCFMSFIENLFNFTVRYLLQMGHINYEPFKDDIYRYLGTTVSDMDDLSIDFLKPILNYEFTCAVVKVMFEKYKAQLFESLNLFMDVAFWTINSIFKYDDDVTSKVMYGHLINDETRFNLLIESLGIGPTSNKMKPSEIVYTMFKEVYKMQMELNRNSNMEVTPPIVSRYNLIDMERHLTELQWDLIKNTSMRSCANCGLKPTNPIVCLLCGSLVCCTNQCCNKTLTSVNTRFMARVEKELKDMRKSEFFCILDEEMITHANACGGGQCIYFSPYHCRLALVDDKRCSTTTSIYSDQYGNSDLHGKVYGDVKLAKVRLENIVNMYCSGRLTNEIEAHRSDYVNIVV